MKLIAPDFLSRFGEFWSKPRRVDRLWISEIVVIETLWPSDPSLSLRLEHGVDQDGGLPSQASDSRQQWTPQASNSPQPPRPAFLEFLHFLPNVVAILLGWNRSAINTEIGICRKISDKISGCWISCLCCLCQSNWQNKTKWILFINPIKKYYRTFL